MNKSSTLTLFALIVLGICSQAAFSQSSKQNEVGFSYNLFKDWLTRHSKQYGIEEMAIRYASWKANYDHVQEHNAKDLSYKLEMNHFADMTSEEFSSLHLGLNVNSNTKNNKNQKKTNSSSNSNSKGKSEDNKKESGSNHSTNANHTANHTTNHTPYHAPIPKSVDWRTQGAVSNVKNQGQCGGCWSFSASGALEGLHAIKEKKLISFSEQQMIDCAGDYGNQGCSGGLMTSAFEYTQNQGIEPESGYPYTGTDDNCKQNSKRVAFRNKGYGQVTANNATALKVAVAQQPVSVGIEASSMTVQLFQSGVITDGCSTDLDHGVLVVGYDTTSYGQGYWIVKNSWGPTWGLNGYFHIAMGTQNDGSGVCGINMMASYPTL